MSLPAPGTSFLGRERELAEAGSLLADARLLTVTGPGGAGKTRFALELARRAGKRDTGYHELGAAFLASLRDPALVLPTIARTLELREQPGQSALEAIASHLDGKRTLLVADNLEHLPASWAELSALVGTCPGLTLLVTTRAPLHAPDEVVYELPPLRDDEGIALFCERAKTEPSPTIAEIAARLEGLPLAIELAAARTKLLTPAQLLERLSQRLDLLKGSREADPRQQTLRATITWSFDLLSQEEQALFARLSVFAGGWTEEAARAVAQAEPDLLSSLVDKSLVRRSEGRFRMLETVREFSAEMLERSGEAERTYARRRSFFARLADELAPVRYGNTSAEERRRFEADRANFLSVLEEAIDVGDAATALGLLRHVGDHLHASTGYRESYGLARRALELPGGTDHDRAYVLLHASRFAGELRLAEEYRSFARSAEAILAEQGDTTGVWQVVQERAFFERSLGNLSEALSAGERAVAIARRVGDPVLEMIALQTLAWVLVETEIARADPNPDGFERSLALFVRAFELGALEERSGYEQWVFLTNHAWLLCVAGDSEQAFDRARVALQVATREHVSTMLMRANILVLGVASTYAGQLESGAQLVAAALGMYESEGQPLQPIEALACRELEAFARDALGDAAYATVVCAGRRLSSDEAVALALSLERETPVEDAHKKRSGRKREVTGDE